MLVHNFFNSSNYPMQDFVSANLAHFEVFEMPHVCHALFQQAPFKWQNGITQLWLEKFGLKREDWRN